MVSQVNNVQVYATGSILDTYFPLTQTIPKKCNVNYLYVMSVKLYNYFLFHMKKVSFDETLDGDAFPSIQGCSHSQLPHPNKLLQSRYCNI